MSTPDSEPQFQQDPNIGKALIRASLGDMRSQLDAYFMPLGLEASTRIGGIHYEGKLNGRFVSASFAVRSRSRYVTSGIRYRKYQGLVMDLIVTSDIQTRMIVMPQKRQLVGFTEMIQRWRKNEQVTDLPDSFDSLDVWAHDALWAADYLSSQETQTALETLLLNSALTKIGTFIVGPGQLQATMDVSPASVTPETMQTWIEALILLVTQIEGKRPSTTVTPTWFEKQNPRTAAWIVALAFLLGIPALLFTCCILPALALVLINGL